MVTGKRKHDRKLPLDTDIKLTGTAAWPVQGRLAHERAPAG